MNVARGSGSTNSVHSFLVSKATNSHSSAPHVLNDLEQRIRCQPLESKPEGPADPLVLFAAFWIDYRIRCLLFSWPTFLSRLLTRKDSSGCGSGCLLSSGLVVSGVGSKTPSFIFHPSKCC